MPVDVKFTRILANSATIASLRHLAEVLPVTFISSEFRHLSRLGVSIATVTNILNDWLQGDEEAAGLLFNRYAKRLAVLAEKRLSQKLASRVDGEDIVQSVFRTFFERSARGEFRIKNSVEIWQLLVTITLAKVHSQGRHHTYGKRDVNAEIGQAPETWLPQAVSHEPGPAEAVALVDQIESLLKGLPQAYSEILTQRLEGYTRTQIAQRMNISRQTVYRVLNLLQERLQKSL